MRSHLPHGWDSWLVRFHHSLVIGCAPDLVFAWIEDPERARQWQPDVAGGEVLHAEPGMVGTEFREVLADGRGHVEMHGRITEFRPGTSMAVRLEGQGMTVTARYEVSPHPAGTLLDAQQSLTLPGPWRTFSRRWSGDGSPPGHAPTSSGSRPCARASPPHDARPIEALGTPTRTAGGPR